MRFFNQINLQTPESVELEFTLAGIGNRSLALLIDYIIVSLSMLLVWGTGFFVLFQLTGVGLPDKLSQWIVAIQSMTAFAISVGYFVVLETVWGGQTLGKKWTKIRVIRDDGKPARLPQAILRGLLRPVDVFTSVGSFFIIFTRQEKRLGDMVAGTVVVQEESKVAQVDIDPEAENLAVRLKVDAELDRLLPDDFATIRDFLQRRKSIMLEYQHQLSRKLAQQVLEIILLDAVPEGYSNSQFLEAIYLAYQQDDLSAQ